MQEREQALRQALNGDRLCHIDMIDCLERGGAQILLQEPEGLLLYDQACQKYGLTARAPAFVEKALGLCQPGRTLVCHQDWLLEEAAQTLGLERMDFYHGVYDLPAPPPRRGPEPEIRPLDPGWLDQVSPHYYNDSNREYLGRVMAKGELFGALIEGELAGFIGCHEEGTYGILEVLPQFRRRGIGYALERHIIGWLLAQGRTPYCQIAVDNKASIALQNRLGLSLSEQPVHWLFPED